MNTTARKHPRPQDVQPGRFFVNESKGQVREVVQEIAGGGVQWRDYWFKTGQPTNFSYTCSREHLARWADREATPDEMLLEEARNRGLIP
jgi:hypothetical protein